mgnify:CR=1 FL=1
MLIKNFTGYVLSTDLRTYTPGLPWQTVDSRVWVCPTLGKAKKVLRESRSGLQIDPCIWTTIYQVSGKNIVFEKSKTGLLYTSMPTKLFINRVMCYEPIPELSEEQLLNRAKAYSKCFCEYAANAFENDKER